MSETSLLDRFSVIKEGTIKVRTDYSNMELKPEDYFKCSVLSDLIFEDIDKHKDETFLDLFNEVCSNLGYSAKNHFSSVASTEEEFNLVFDGVENKLK